MPSREPVIAPALRTLIVTIAPRVVVIGSVARGVRWPKDLDLYWDMDSEPAYALISKAIEDSKLEFISPFIRSWSFMDYGWPVEIIPINYGPPYKVVRRRAMKRDIIGMTLWVARPEDARKRSEKTPSADEWTAAEQRAAPRQRRCTKCGDPGHTLRTCGNL